jgi:hypothetical protein
MLGAQLLSFHSFKPVSLSTMCSSSKSLLETLYVVYVLDYSIFNRIISREGGYAVRRQG